MRIINEALLDEFRGPGVCEWCRKLVSRREAAHIMTKGMGGGRQMDHRWNLVALCAVFSGGDNCHHEHHQGHRPLACDLLAVVAAREGVLQSDVEAELWKLRRL